MVVLPDPEVKLRPITVAELDRMVQEGILGEDDRVELLAGALAVMSPRSPEHAAVLHELLRLLAPPAIAAGLRISSRSPLGVGQELSRPEPDLALAPRPEPGRHPSGALLVVEVAIGSRALDLGAKAAIYARAGVTDYWVVDVSARELVVHREPVADRFRLVRRLAEGESVAPLAVAAQVAVSDLLVDVPAAPR
ncbi:MAG: Uma2 family endonuclease [Actinomycetota bacterium]|nr:Uma2 family endonuclease [Actinomycetota bacterium]